METKNGTSVIETDRLLNNYMIMEEKILSKNEFYKAYINFYGDGYYDLIENAYNNYIKGEIYTNKSFFIDAYLNPNKPEYN